MASGTNTLSEKLFLSVITVVSPAPLLTHDFATIFPAP